MLVGVDFFLLISVHLELLRAHLELASYTTVLAQSLTDARDRQLSWLPLLEQEFSTEDTSEMPLLQYLDLHCYVIKS